jgi:hypothetical protein
VHGGHSGGFLRVRTTPFSPPSIRAEGPIFLSGRRRCARCAYVELGRRDTEHDGCACRFRRFLHYGLIDRVTLFARAPPMRLTDPLRPAAGCRAFDRVKEAFA